MNWNLEVILALIGFLFFLTICIILARLIYREKNLIFEYILLTFIFFAAYHFFEATSYLFLSFELKRLSMISVSISLLFLILNVEQIIHERVAYYKIFIIGLLIGITIISVFIPGNLEFYYHNYWGYPTIGMKGFLQIFIITITFILCYQLSIWLYKTWKYSPPELKKDAFMLFSTSIFFYISMLALFLTGIYLIIPILYVFTTITVSIAAIYIFRQPKLLYILSFRGKRITVINNKEMKPIFDLTWYLLESEYNDQDNNYIKLTPIIYQLSKSFEISYNIKELKLEHSRILFIHTKYITVILLTSKTSLILKKCLLRFTVTFEEHYSNLIKTGMINYEYFKDAVDLVNQIFPLGSMSSIGTYQKLEDYLEQIVKHRDYEYLQMMEKLMESERSKSLFLASVSHELRTPLNSILGFVEILKDGLAGEVNDEQQDYLETIYKSSEHLLSLINRILDISKIESGNISLELEEFCINETIELIINILGSQIKKKKIRLQLNIEPDLKIYSDKERFKQILFNLIGNAIKFTLNNGEIKITASYLNKNMIVIHVIDNGIGIDLKDLNKIFMPFQQVDMSMTKKHPGSGLGLYLVKNLVGILGGTISVKSKIDKGSDFYFQLPKKNKAKTDYKK